MASAPTNGPPQRPDLRKRLIPSGHFEPGSYVRVLCPFHGDTRKAGGSVYEGHFYCHTCGAWKGRYEFLPLIDRGEVKPIATVSNYDEGLSYLPPTLADSYARILQGPRKQRKEWLYARGLTDETIQWARLGHTGRAFTIPILAAGDASQAESGVRGASRVAEAPDALTRPVPTLRAIKYRADPAYELCLDPEECRCPKYWGVRGHNRGLLYRPGGVLEGTRRVVLTEGEFDALLLIQAGIPAVSTINGSRDLAPFAPLRALSEVVVAYDQDLAGQRGALRVRDYLGNARIVTWHVEKGEDGKLLEGQPKDVTEFIQQRGIAAFRRLARV